MNISSTPFIRNDYWPDYNDINQLNQRVNEVENELSLTNIRLSTDIENVSNNLNSYADNQANTTIANNIIVNNINANYAVGKFVNFGNANFDNAYVENLTVNRPVFDITLNTPHIENVTSLGGNIYDANMFNVSITGGNVAFNNLSVEDLTAVNATISNVNILDGNVNLNKATISDVNASNATISNLFVNTQPEPVQSSAVLGYDSQGRVIPIEAVFDVGFPENANYLFTDEHGTAFAGVAATDVSTINNLITAHGVQNGFNNLAETEQIDMNDTFSYLWDKPAVVNFFNSESPLNYKGITDVNYNAGSFISSYYLGNNVYIRLNGTTLEFSLPVTVSSLFYTGTSNMYITNNESMQQAFYNCESLNQNILIPDGVTSIIGVFAGCTSLNQNILIPNSVFSMTSAFWDCTSLNQNILIPSSVISMRFAFNNCVSLNQNIYIYSDQLPVTPIERSLQNTFLGCSLLSDKYIHIRSSIPMDTSNNIYNSLVNNYTGINWTGRVVNDLEEPTQWPPEV